MTTGGQGSDSDADVQDIVSSFGDLSKAMQVVNEIQFNKANRFLLEITKTTKSSGQLWVAMARFFSGGAFWRIQNKIKAYSNLLRFREKMQQEALKKEQENVKQLAIQVEHEKSINEILEKNGLKDTYEPEITPEQLAEKIGNFQVVVVRSRTKLVKELI